MYPRRRPRFHTFSRAVSHSSLGSSSSSSPQYLAGLSIPDHIQLSLESLEKHYKRYHASQSHSKLTHSIASFSTQIRFIPDLFLDFCESPLLHQFILSTAHYLAIFLEYLQFLQSNLYEIRVKQAIHWNSTHSTNYAHSAAVLNHQQPENELLAMQHSPALKSRLSHSLAQLSHHYTQILLYRLDECRSSFSASIGPGKAFQNPFFDAAFFECLYATLSLTMERVFEGILKDQPGLPQLSMPENGKIMAQSSGGNKRVQSVILNQQWNNADSKVSSPRNGFGNSDPAGSNSGEEKRSPFELTIEVADRAISTSSSHSHSNSHSSLHFPSRPMNLSVAIPPPTTTSGPIRTMPVNANPNPAHSGSVSGDEASYPYSAASIPPIPPPKVDIPPIRFPHLQWEMNRLFRSPNFKSMEFQSIRPKEKHAQGQTYGNGTGTGTGTAGYGSGAYASYSGRYSDNISASADELFQSLESNPNSVFHTGLDVNDPYIRYLSSAPLVPPQPFVSQYANYPGPTLLKSLMDLRSPLLCATLPAQKVLLRDNRRYAMGTMALQPKPPRQERASSSVSGGVHRLVKKELEEEKFSQSRSRSRFPPIQENGHPSQRSAVPRLELAALTQQSQSKSGADKFGSSFRASASARLAGVSARLDRLASHSLTARTESDWESSARSTYSLDDRLRSTRPIVRVRGRSIELNDEQFLDDEAEQSADRFSDINEE